MTNNYKNTLIRLVETELQKYLDHLYPNTSDFLLVRVKELYYNEKNRTYNALVRELGREEDYVYYIANIRIKYGIEVISVKRLEDVLEGY